MPPRIGEVLAAPQLQSDCVPGVLSESGSVGIKHLLPASLTRPGWLEIPTDYLTSDDSYLAFHPVDVRNVIGNSRLPATSWT